ncbi:MAG: J domain-containing protein, partial [Spirochaetales bacterium]|nr:J domain-containing protein [Spirochaetales bacterium]
MNSENPFKILKISPSSGVEEIKQAFHSLILSVHPDVNHSS